MEVLKADAREKAMAAEMDETGEAPTTDVGDALKILVRNAIEEFGFAPRDVYEGVFRLSMVMVDHAEAIEHLDYGYTVPNAQKRISIAHGYTANQV